MKVAFASTRGTTVDQHFGRAGSFAIWDITPEGGACVEQRSVAAGDLDLEVVSTRGMGAEHDDAITAKIAKLSDVKIVYFTEIGGPSAAKLVRQGIMPLKAEEGTSIEATVESLAHTMATNPAPWMRKALASESCDGPGDPDSIDTCRCESAGGPCCC